ncbi:MAG: hypothetical protein JRE47_06350 [Deltaproteobacteria bacterium]|nr:hypothetical protein [Deltaproteobacteria bacterium]
MSWGYYPRYVSVAEKKAKAAKKLKQLKKKNHNIRPVVIEGSAIAGTWWGKSWNRNLERYADYSNRIGRGRSYVRHGAVLDLQIDAGKVESLVQGTRSKPYSVSIKIKAIDNNIWREIKTSCSGKLDSMQELLAGKFPKALNEIFMAQGKGLFPSPEEIEFSCSCPDWAYMCKHVAATLYGIGVRLDEDPGLFFKLRKVRMEDLITGAVEDNTRKLLEKAKKKTKRVITDSDLANVFDIDMDVPAGLIKKSDNIAKKSIKKKKAPDHTSKRTKDRSATNKPRKKIAAKKVVFRAKAKVKVETLSDTVLDVIRRSKKGVTVSVIREKTGLKKKQIQNCIYKAKKQGMIKNKARGIYMPL